MQRIIMMRLGYAESGTNAVLMVAVPNNYHDSNLGIILRDFGTAILESLGSSKTDIKDHITRAMYDLMAGDADNCGHYIDALFNIYGFDFWPTLTTNIPREFISIDRDADIVIADAVKNNGNISEEFMKYYIST